MSSDEMKQFVMTLVATTVSIVLTFGTTAIIDRHKKRADKRKDRLEKARKEGAASAGL